MLKILRSYLYSVFVIHRARTSRQQSAPFAGHTCAFSWSCVMTGYNSGSSQCLLACLQTGDFLATAVGIAKQVGIITNEHVETMDDARGYASKESLELSNDPGAPIHSLAVEGAELETMSAEDWDIIVDRYKEMVFARTTPEQKLRIVEELKARRDNTVAVTGDGVNDAPALQAADIGVAMGAGSDVAKDAAAIVLLNNDFASIPVAIENGRLVFDNLKKVVLYLLPAGSYTEFMAVFANIFLGTQIPMSSFLQGVLFTASAQGSKLIHLLQSHSVSSTMSS